MYGHIEACCCHLCCLRCWRNPQCQHISRCCLKDLKITKKSGAKDPPLVFFNSRPLIQIIQLRKTTRSTNKTSNISSLLHKFILSLISFLFHSYLSLTVISLLAHLYPLLSFYVVLSSPIST